MSGPTVEVVRSANPRKKKTWTYEQAQSKKDQAERFARDVLEDDDLGDELEDSSVEEYAERRGVELVNSEKGESTMRKKNGSRSKGTTAGAAVAEARENPTIAALETATKALDKQNQLQARVRELEAEVDEQDKLLDSIIDIIDDDDPNFKPSERLEEIGDLFPEDDDDEGEE